MKRSASKDKRKSKLCIAESDCGKGGYWDVLYQRDLFHKLVGQRARGKELWARKEDLKVLKKFVGQS